LGHATWVMCLADLGGGTSKSGRLVRRSREAIGARSSLPSHIPVPWLTPRLVLEPPQRHGAAQDNGPAIHPLRTQLIPEGNGDTRLGGEPMRADCSTRRMRVRCARARGAVAQGGRAPAGPPLSHRRCARVDPDATMAVCGKRRELRWPRREDLLACGVVRARPKSRCLRKRPAHTNRRFLLAASHAHDRGVEALRSWLK
jgi:hypothetical protein